jgi:hypothetical protein
MVFSNAGIDSIEELSAAATLIAVMCNQNGAPRFAVAV